MVKANQAQTNRCKKACSALVDEVKDAFPLARSR
ncbi:hypothetical protein M272_21815 [Vibrio natriegens NBRC 15636 = ATCC 14048 = DSM 759]|jgi:hypothetical protein|nr:hypothetical protein M272_21815 [Vibrio natriegens NBRC 15636 = ATCC 14048 = DSM 759]